MHITKVSLSEAQNDLVSCARHSWGLNADFVCCMYVLYAYKVLQVIIFMIYVY